MGFLDLFKSKDINEGVREFRETEGALLIDVRDEDEYADGHIPGSINIPLDEIKYAGNILGGKRTPIFTYCLTGARSSQAVDRLRNRGYVNVKNIGGISKYQGELE